jgi:hypothetical protein
MWSIPAIELVLDFEHPSGSESMRVILVSFASLLVLAPVCHGQGADKPAGGVLERITFDDEGTSRTISGRVLVKAVDGGLLVQERDGRLWTVTSETLEKRESSGEAFRPEESAALGKRLAAELDKKVAEGFRAVSTRHYTIVSSADPRFTRWVGTLFERLRSAFVAYWKGRGVKLSDPEFPLVAIVLKDRAQFSKFVTVDAKLDPTTVTGYYSIMTNRIVLYDIARIPGQAPAATSVEIQRRLATAPQAIATVVHEAAHQVAYNSGMNRRLSDNPLWLVEGMAVFFETPDLRSRSGWRTVGKVNLPRLARFSDYVRRRRRVGSLKTLICSDRRLRDVESSADAYAEAWALSYFLLRTRRKQYAAYLKTISAKPLLRWDTPETRQSDFEAAFGEDWEELDRVFLKYLGRVRVR